ncbi:hypothetical protein [Flavobacterium album]|nr:hypothetical protein [Flavobacterium album]
MDLSTTIIGVALLAICLVPLVLAHNKKKKKQQQLLKALTGLAESYSCKITQHDLWQNTAIGIDENAKCVFFVKNTDGANSLQKVHLAAINDAYSNGDPDPVASEKLELLMVHAGGKEFDIALEFYNPEVSMQINDEWILLKKWQGILQEAIRK